MTAGVGSALGALGGAAGGTGSALGAGASMGGDIASLAAAEAAAGIPSAASVGAGLGGIGASMGSDAASLAFQEAASGIPSAAEVGSGLGSGIGGGLSGINPGDFSLINDGAQLSDGFSLIGDGASIGDGMSLVGDMSNLAPNLFSPSNIKTIGEVGAGLGTVGNMLGNSGSGNNILPTNSGTETPGIDPSKYSLIDDGPQLSDRFSLTGPGPQLGDNMSLIGDNEWSNLAPGLFDGTNYDVGNLLGDGGKGILDSIGNSLGNTEDGNMWDSVKNWFSDGDRSTGLSGLIDKYGGIIGSGLDMFGDYYGAKQSSDALTKAAKIQADAARQAQLDSQAYQERMLGQAAGYLNPYINRFSDPSTLDEYANFGTSGLGGQLTGQMADLANRGLNLDYKADPAYQWRKQQQEEAINRQLAGRGMYDSRYGMDVLSDAGMNLSGQEADKQYMRAVDEYNRQYGDLTNRYNLGYQDVLNRFGTGNTAANNLAGMYSGLGTNIGNQILSTGVNSAANTALLNSQAGQTMGNMWAGLGNTAASALSDWRFQPYMDKIMERMGEQQQQPRITFG
jgi:hypothetical protein